ncbi:MAG: hypothetical protein KUG65_00170 [Sphingomonadaceae bacterium]|nr:hypothetical protein [Sphingomonadaceae bacterium]
MELHPSLAMRPNHVNSASGTLLARLLEAIDRYQQNLVADAYVPGYLGGHQIVSLPNQS